MGIESLQDMQFSPEELQSIAYQLACPSGKQGILLGKKMYQSNLTMIRTCFENWKACNGDKIMELGHGNAAHVTALFNDNTNFSYYGLEISKTMFREARSINRIFMEAGKATFELYDGVHIPYQDDFFNHIFTINTIYFWQNPVKLLAEAYRVLKDGGRLSLAFATPEFMKTLAFSHFGFKLYEIEEWSGFFYDAGFQEEHIDYYTEDVLSKDNQPVSREFVRLVLRK